MPDTIVLIGKLMASPDFYAKQNRKMSCKKCGIKMNSSAFNDDGLCKKCARAAKNHGLGSFVK
jgi:tRNA(Ile2) C34 agmatinyltransferase TiaS